MGYVFGGKFKSAPTLFRSSSGGGQPAVVVDGGWSGATGAAGAADAVGAVSVKISRFSKFENILTAYLHDKMTMFILAVWTLITERSTYSDICVGLNLVLAAPPSARKNLTQLSEQIDRSV